MGMFSVKKFEVIRVEFEDGVYCQITPSDVNEGYRDFWLFRKNWGVSQTMFACEVKTDEEAVELAVANAPDYIPYLMDQCE
jgi:hypothetical protein